MRAVTKDYASVYGLAWHPGGEIWFTAAEAGSERVLMATSLQGKVRRVLGAATALNLYDIAADGSVLMSSEEPRLILEYQGKHDKEPRDLSWYAASIIKEISRLRTMPRNGQRTARVCTFTESTRARSESNASTC
jgi:hypothetical protein